MFKFYSKDSDKNRVTIVGQIDNGLLFLAASRCSDTDKFIKAKGEGLAKKRLFSKQLLGIYPITNPENAAKEFVTIARKEAAQLAKDKHPIRIQFIAYGTK